MKLVLDLKKKRYLSDFGVVEFEMSEEQHLTGNVQQLTRDY